MKKMKELTKSDVEGIRGELYHMILFAMAWALIGEYSLDYRDYILGAGLILVIVVRVALYSIKLYDLEDNLNADASDADELKQFKRDRFYLRIIVFEGVAILVTWTLLHEFGHYNWLISSFALIAGLHFFPLARLIRQNSYYFLGVWVCLLAFAGYLLIISGTMPDYYANTLVAYGCAAGAAVDSVGIMMRTRTALKRV
jgi:uncharacterized membrane protein